MKFKILLALFAFSFLPSCYNLKVTSEQYERLPLKVQTDPEKVGKACDERFYPLAFLYVNADITVESARKNGEIKQISSIETEVSSRGLFYKKICTIVKGN